jgi:hypothetical protein
MISDGHFKRLLEDGIKDYLGWVLLIYLDSAVVIAAKGAAELRRCGKAL